MNFIYFICPETPQLAKYCEGFFNYLTYGYKSWSRDRYVSSTPADKTGKSRLLRDSRSPMIEEMKAGDFVLDRIYKKVITSDCYQHSYQQISKDEVELSKFIIFITSNTNPRPAPSYLNSTTNSVITWRMSKVDSASDNKYELLEALVRRMVNTSKD